MSETAGYNSTQNASMPLVKQRWSEQTVKFNMREVGGDKNQRYEDEKQQKPLQKITHSAQSHITVHLWVSLTDVSHARLTSVIVQMNGQINAGHFFICLPMS